MAFFIPDLSSWQGNLPNFDAIAAACRTWSTASPAKGIK